MVDRAINLCEDETLKEEINHVRKTLLQNDYPKRFIDDTIKERIRKRKNNDIRRNKGSETRSKAICMPYYPVIGEQIRKIAKNFGYTIAFKSLKDLRSILRSDKVKIPTDRRPRVVYAIKCGCGARYFGETGHGTAQTEGAPDGVDTLQERREKATWRNDNFQRPSTRKRPSHHHERSGQHFGMGGALGGLSPGRKSIQLFYFESGR
uniref:Helix-turn-helix domain-containing protein n=1 Tax=Trichuris muris TaxID=70415 RepID=A0A5S6QBT1_TRIMR